MRAFALTVALLGLSGPAQAGDDPEPPADASLRKLGGTWTTDRA
jgi:hypothetical protein